MLSAEVFLVLIVTEIFSKSTMLTAQHLPAFHNPKGQK